MKVAVVCIRCGKRESTDIYDSELAYFDFDKNGTCQEVTLYRKCNQCVLKTQTSKEDK